MIEVLLIMLLFSGAKQSDFSKEKTLFLKAFLPFLVIASHYCPSIITPAKNIQLLGWFSVSIFFFISGYGLSVKVKKNRLKLSYLVNKVICLLIPLAIAVYMYIGFCSLFVEKPLNIDLLSDIKNNYVVHPTTWFVISLVYLNIIFFVAHSFFEKKQLLVLTVLVLLLMLSQKLCNMSGTYFMSDLAFVSGAFFAKYGEKVQKVPMWVIKVSFSFLMLLELIHLKGFTFVNSFLLPICFILLFCSIKLFRNKIVDFLSKISYELYLGQIVAAVVVYHYFERGIESFVFIVLLDVVLAYVICVCSKMLKTLFSTMVLYRKGKET